MTNLSIVLPTYNEKDNIIDLINKIKEVVSLNEPKIAENLEFVNADIRDTEYLRHLFLYQKRRPPPWLYPYK